MWKMLSLTTSDRKDEARLPPTVTATDDAAASDLWGMTFSKRWFLRPPDAMEEKKSAPPDSSGKRDDWVSSLELSAETDSALTDSALMDSALTDSAFGVVAPSAIGSVRDGYF